MAKNKIKISLTPLEAAKLYAILEITAKTIEEYAVKNGTVPTVTQDLDIWVCAKICEQVKEQDHLISPKGCKKEYKEHEIIYLELLNEAAKSN